MTPGSIRITFLLSAIYRVPLYVRTPRGAYTDEDGGLMRARRGRIWVRSAAQRISTHAPRREKDWNLSKRQNGFVLQAGFGRRPQRPAVAWNIALTNSILDFA
jgi:hypothetical protein